MKFKFLSDDHESILGMLNQGIGSSTLFGMSTATKPDMDFQEGSPSRFDDLVVSRF